MIHAYDELYLDKARIALGRMLDFAINDLHADLHEFWKRFLNSEVCKGVEHGDSSFIVGMSGIEMAYSVLGDHFERVEAKTTLERSEEYWLGWALAYYQWDTGMAFRDLFEVDDIVKIKSLYSPYHEMDIRQFCDKLNEMYHGKNSMTNLKRCRTSVGLSQSQLSVESGVPLRTIQQYEQRQKNINKAQAEYVVRLAKALYCDPEDLLEKVPLS